MLLENELALVRETTDRVRRIETRLTSFMIEHGMTPPTDAVHYDLAETLILPTLHASVRDVMAAAPCAGRYCLTHQGTILGFIDVFGSGHDAAKATTMPKTKGVVSPRR